MFSALAPRQEKQQENKNQKRKRRWRPGLVSRDIRGGKCEAQVRKRGRARRDVGAFLNSAARSPRHSLSLSLTRSLFRRRRRRRNTPKGFPRCRRRRRRCCSFLLPFSPGKATCIPRFSNVRPHAFIFLLFLSFSLLLSLSLSVIQIKCFVSCYPIWMDFYGVRMTSSNEALLFNFSFTFALLHVLTNCLLLLLLC